LFQHLQKKNDTYIFFIIIIIIIIWIKKSGLGEKGKGKKNGTKSSRAKQER
jgi:hypothetical protein